MKTLNQLILGLGLALGITGCSHLKRNVKESPAEIEQIDDGEKSEKWERWKNENSEMRQAAKEAYDECCHVGGYHRHDGPSRERGQELIETITKYALKVRGDEKRLGNPPGSWKAEAGLFLTLATYCGSNTDDIDSIAAMVALRQTASETYQNFLNNSSKKTALECVDLNSRCAVQLMNRSDIEFSYLKYVDQAKECAWKAGLIDHLAEKYGHGDQRTHRQWRETAQIVQAAEDSWEKYKEAAKECVERNTISARELHEEKASATFWTPKRPEPERYLERAKECASVSKQELSPEAEEICRLENDLEEEKYRVCSRSTQAGKAKMILIGVGPETSANLLTGCLEDKDLVLVSNYQVGENLAGKNIFGLNDPEKKEKKTKVEGFGNLQFRKDLRKYQADLRYLKRWHSDTAQKESLENELAGKVEAAERKLTDGYLAQIRKHAGEDSPGKVYFMADAREVAVLSSSLTKEGIEHVAYCPDDKRIEMKEK